MTGCLQIKNGMYYAVLSVYENGKRKRPWIPTGLPAKGNKRKAEQFLREKLHEYELSSGTVRNDVTLADYVRHWLTIAQRRVDPVTFQGYEVLAKAQILPYFDALGVKLQDVTLPILQTYFDEKAANGRTDGKGGLSATSLRRHKNILHQTMEEAVKNGLLPSNPSRFVELPKVQRYDYHTYTAPQLQALFEAIREDPLAPLVKIAAIYGLRRSELLGLQWDSVDFEVDTLTVKHTVSKVTETVAKDKTKNAASRRTFPLTPEAKAIFQTAKAEEQQNRRMMGREYQETPYIFKWPDGHPFPPDYVSHHFTLLLKKHGLPHIRFRELRHSCASLLLNQGYTLKDVQEWMGHADIQMTANIYGHLDMQRKQNIAAQLSASLS